MCLAVSPQAVFTYCRWRPLSDGTPRAYPHILIASRIIGLHFATTDIGANRKRVCDFLLVRHSNLGPILHRFGDQTGFMCFWPHPYSTLILGECSRWTRSPMLGVSERMGLKLFGREIIFEEFQPMWSWYLNVTDGRTDRNKRHAIS